MPEADINGWWDQGRVFVSTQFMNIDAVWKAMLSF